ncbi:MAG TPA: FAD-dependent oxidoreductase [Dehalococcoidia bacterium]|nr:FAD-dependent oxidoreductase [Dehalococcoidia bacterium]
MAKYVIVGNSAGGIGAAEAIREVDSEGSVCIISDEPFPVYSRPLISEFLAGERTLEEMLYRPRDFYQQNAIEALLGQKVVGIDFPGARVVLEGGESLPWERLLLATGGTPIVPSIAGRDKEGVFTFTTLEDARRMERFLEGKPRVVVIGGGLIGMSLASALVKRGLGVVMVELLDRVLGAVLDEPASRLVEGVLREVGIELITGQTVREITGKSFEEGRVGGVVLQDGRQLSCGLVVIAIGVAPRTELVKNSPVKVNRGVVVDRHMATSYPHVYACGDVAEGYDFVYGTGRLTPIWPNAYLGGRIAGYNMAGKQTLYPGGTAANSFKYFGYPLVSAGMVNPQDGCEVLVSRQDRSYRKVVLKDDHIVGLVFAGDIQQAGVAFGLMRGGVNVGPFKDALVRDDFGLTFIPQSLRRAGLGVSPREMVP